LLEVESGDDDEVVSRPVIISVTALSTIKVEELTEMALKKGDDADTGDLGDNIEVGDRIEGFAEFASEGENREDVNE